MARSKEDSVFKTLLNDERELSYKYTAFLLSSANAEIQAKLQYVQRSNNETVAMLLSEADSRGSV